MQRQRSAARPVDRDVAARLPARGCWNESTRGPRSSRATYGHEGRGHFDRLSGRVRSVETPEESRSKSARRGEHLLGRSEAGRPPAVAGFPRGREVPKIHSKHVCEADVPRAGRHGRTSRSATRRIRSSSRSTSRASSARPGESRWPLQRTAEINREDWGMTWNAALKRRLVVGKKVTLEIEPS